MNSVTLLRDSKLDSGTGRRQCSIALPFLKKMILLESLRILAYNSVPKLAIKCESKPSAYLRRRNRVNPGNQGVGGMMVKEDVCDRPGDRPVQVGASEHCLQKEKIEKIPSVFQCLMSL